MKTTLGALAIAVTLVAGIGAASAMPHNDLPDNWQVKVFQPDN